VGSGEGSRETGGVGDASTLGEGARVAARAVSRERGEGLGLHPIKMAATSKVVANMKTIL